MQQNDGDIKRSAIKRNIKDSVFTHLFSKHEYLVQLYRALHPEDDTVTESDVYCLTIKNILTNDRYNDLGFCVGEKLIILMECQTTWSTNIALRMMIYLFRTYGDYLNVKNLSIYGSESIDIPKPELYVLYTGSKSNKPEYISLKDDFFKSKDCCVDAKIKVLYDGTQGDIINQYVTFTKIFSEQVKIHGRTDKAIIETVQISRDKNILSKYLKEREVEVMNILESIFDDERIQRLTLYQERKKGEKIARRLAAKNLIKQGDLSFETIASCLNISIDEVKYVANHMDEIEAEKEDDEMLLVS